LGDLVGRTASINDNRPRRNKGISPEENAAELRYGRICTAALETFRYQHEPGIPTVNVVSTLHATSKVISGNRLQDIEKIDFASQAPRPASPAPYLGFSPLNWSRVPPYALHQAAR
jgi:hypothetical protein